MAFLRWGVVIPMWVGEVEQVHTCVWASLGDKRFGSWMCEDDGLMSASEHIPRIGKLTQTKERFVCMSSIHLGMSGVAGEIMDGDVSRM